MVMLPIIHKLYCTVYSGLFRPCHTQHKRLLVLLSQTSPAHPASAQGRQANRAEEAMAVLLNL